MILLLQIILTLVVVSKISFNWAGSLKVVAMIVVGILVFCFSWYILVILGIYFVVCLLK